MTSHNPNDERERYCGNCHDFIPREEGSSHIAHIAAMKLVLLFHSGEPWTEEREIEWIKCLRVIENSTGHVLCGARRPEVTTRVLCEAVRAAMGHKPF